MLPPKSLPQPAQGRKGLRDRWDAISWTVIAVLLWTLISVLKVQVARMTPFDAMALALLGGLLLHRFVGRGRKAPPERWRAALPGYYYLMMGALICAGLLSGLNATDLQLWSVEIFTFLYLLGMLWALDLFTKDRIDRFLDLGGWTFAALFAACGTVATVFLLGGPQLGFFYETGLDGLSPKMTFTGPMRFPNQWAGYFLAVFPLLLALNFKPLSRWQRAALLVCTLLGFVTIPASGSRSGMFLTVAEIGGFALLYMILSRSGHLLMRVVTISLFVIALGGTYWLLFDQASDSPILVRSLGAFDLVFEQESLADRWREYNWLAAMSEFGKHPFIGMGLGTFERFYDKHEVHSSYLSFAAETGVAGLIPYLVLVAVPLLSLVRALAAYASRGKADVMLIALTLAIVSQLAFAIHHNNTRHRHVWLLLFCGTVYAELALVRLGAALAQERARRPAPTRSRREATRHRPEATDRRTA